jgi:hypothetical protein
MQRLVACDYEMQKRYPLRMRRPPVAWLLAAALVLFAAHRALMPMRETDLFFHLKIGQLILERHAIPFRNLFSFTYPDAPDPDLAWGFQVLVAIAYRLGGFGAIVVVKAMFFAGACALAWAVARRAGASALASALAVALAVCAADQRLVERPHLVTFAAIGALGLLLERRAWRWIPPLIWIWANFHAGVFLGLVMLLLGGAGAILDGEKPPRQYWLITALSLVAVFLTPAGLRLPRYLLWHTGLGATRIIEEFRRADLWDDPWFFAQGTLALASAVAVKRWRRILPVVAVALLAWRSVRFVAEWALLAAPLCALGLDAMLRGLDWHPRRLAEGVLALALVVVVSVERRDGTFEIGLGADVVPFDAIDFVTREGLRDRLYSGLDVGCYLLWEGWPRYRVFQDARLPAYPDEFHRALDQTPLDPASFDALLHKYGVDAALITDPDVDMRAASFDPDEWALVWRTPSALVYARRTPERRALIARTEVPLRARFAFDGGTRWEPMRAPPARSPVAACEWSRRLVAQLADDERPDRALEAELRALEAGCLDEREEARLRAWIYGLKVRVGR